MPEQTHVIRGHKANLTNPNTSEESKQHSKEVIDDMEGKHDGKDPVHVQAGLKAALKNPNVSDEAKESVKERLDGY